MTDRKTIHGIQGADLSLPTYTAGLLQAQAYRALKQFLSGFLADRKLGMPEWALLGLLNEHKSIRLSALADHMHIEASLATTLVNGLAKKGLVERKPDPQDSRAKLVQLTTDGRTLVPQVESSLRVQMKDYMSDVAPAELVVYIGVLAKLAAKS